MECKPRHVGKLNVQGFDGWNVNWKLFGDVFIDQQFGEHCLIFQKAWTKLISEFLEVSRKNIGTEPSAYSPLKIAEVAEAVAVNCVTETFDPEDRLRDQQDILEICSSLIALSGYTVLASSTYHQEQT